MKFIQDSDFEEHRQICKGPLPTSSYKGGGGEGDGNVASLRESELPTKKMVLGKCR